MFMSASPACRSTSSRAPAPSSSRRSSARLGGKPVDPYAIYGAQAAQVLLDAIAASDGTRGDVIAKLFETKVTDGLLGTFEINENGDPAAPRAQSSASRSTRPRTSSRPRRRSLRSRRPSRRPAASWTPQDGKAGGGPWPSPSFALGSVTAMAAPGPTTTLDRLRKPSIVVAASGSALVGARRRLAGRQLRQGPDRVRQRRPDRARRTARSTGSSRSATRSSTGSCS